MEYRVLGSLEVLDRSGHRLTLGGVRQQTVLASLLLSAGSTVPLERLVDDVWEKPPQSAAKTVQVYVSRLRHELEPRAIESRPGGYALVLDGDELDLAQFEQIAGQGRTALAGGDYARSAQLLRDALALWRGPALSGLSAGPLRREADRLEELRLQVVEDRIEADLGRGRAREVVAELQPVVAEHPFRERLRAQLMLALYRAGRQSDALEVYRETRTLLADELGLEPGEDLRQLERRMLAHDPGLELSVPKAKAAPRPSPTPAGEPLRARRPATVVFADVVDSTALAEQFDPESIHGILDRYFRIAMSVLERHGGEVEKFIGDAIVGFFGLTDLHEDDALRAVRAAVELRDAVMELGDEVKQTRGIDFAVKLGVNTGDVFVAPGSQREAYAIGDSVNVAARLEQAADAHEILLGERTYRLVEPHVTAEALEPLALKGRKSKERAWRLQELAKVDAWPSLATQFIGRERELDDLRQAFADTRDDRLCRLCTVVGPAGIGKTRLAREFVAEARGSATVAVGRCLSYGEGITFRALVEIVKQLAGDDPRQRISELIHDHEEAELVARRLRATVGLSEETGPAQETFWAVRRLFEAVAQDRPLVAIVEDAHWAEPLLLDLLEYLVSFCAAAPVFILCLARPDLLETRHSWSAPQANRSLLVLGELAEGNARALVASLAPGDLDPDDAEQIVETAEGNPLFLEQLVATKRELGEGELPPSVQAVLAARIATLDPGERTVLERAAVEGRSFGWSSVASLLPESDRPALGQHVMALVRRQLIQPDPSTLAGEDAFRFNHVLIREAAYAELPKELCAELHERLAQRSSEDEIAGHHLEQAHRCRAQLGLAGDRERALAQEAKSRLEAASRKALLHGDPSSAAGLLERAVSLFSQDDPSRASLLPALGAALLEAGRLSDADRVLTEAIDGSPDELLEARARVERQFVRLQTEPSAVEDAQQVAEDALAIFEKRGDDSGQSRAWCLKASIAWVAGQVAKADEAWRRAAEHASRAGEKRELFEILDWRASAAAIGPTPVDEAIELCIEIREQVRSSPVALAETLQPLATLHAMRGEFDKARALVAEGNAFLDELGRMYSAAISHHGAFVEMLAGNPEAAEERLRRGYERLEEMGEKALLATTAAMLAQAIYAQDRPEEAARYSRASLDAAAGQDLAAVIVGKSAEAKILARAGRDEEAETLAREAVELAGGTDFLGDRGDAFLDLAEVLQLNGKPDEAAAALAAGLELYEQKGDLVSAERARSRLEQVGSA